MEDPIGFEIDGDLVSGGSVQATGEAEIGGPFRIDFQLEGVALAPATPYLAEGQRVGGAVTGTVTTAADQAGGGARRRRRPRPGWGAGRRRPDGSG